MNSTPANGDLLRVEALRKYFHFRGTIVRAVDGISFGMRRGATLGLVGESGSGKTTVGRMILRLAEPTSGRIFFEGMDITGLGARGMRSLRRRMQLIPQDPYSALNPQRSIGWAVTEPYRIHRIGKKSEWENKVRELLATVGVPPDAFNAYPGELSGGQLQRVCIARALSLKPDLLICDEPMSALDVSIQAQVLKLLQDLQHQFGLTYLFISHNLAVVERISDMVAVMYLGRMMEIGGGEAIFERTAHPYTRALLASVPSMSAERKTGNVSLKGDMPSPANPPPGCPFSTRCAHVMDVCCREHPTLRELGNGHFAACHLL
ncbi:MAG: ABC transporter ATP-binding protein [bacterium]|nr:ABC transporter ATP-binding protein [Candidatus Sumerlaeota bacterium]